MNYLAHLLLAENNPDSIIGNLLGDFVKGSLNPENSNYSPAIIQGIKTHRQVDCFTDHHRIYLTSKKRINPDKRRFAGIIIDICYDHFLSRNWGYFSSEKLDDFIANVYLILQENQALLPEKLQLALPRMVAENWLKSYQTPEGISLTFQRISRRLQRTNNLGTSVTELMNNYSGLENDFLTFFPELVTFVEKNRDKI